MAIKILFFSLLFTTQSVINQKCTLNIHFSGIEEFTGCICVNNLSSVDGFHSIVDDTLKT